jgi:hypothetical protein
MKRSEVDPECRLRGELEANRTLVLPTVGRDPFRTIQTSEADCNQHLDPSHKVARTRVVVIPTYCPTVTFQPSTVRKPELQPPAAVGIELALRTSGPEESPVQFFDEASMPCDALVSPGDS